MIIRNERPHDAFCCGDRGLYAFIMQILGAPIIQQLLKKVQSARLYTLLLEGQLFFPFGTQFKQVFLPDG